MAAEATGMPGAGNDSSSTDEMDIDTHDFFPPRKEINQPSDIQAKWEKSQAYRDLLGFLHAMNDAVQGKKITSDVFESEITRNMVEMLNKLDNWIKEFPALESPQRFGNKAFREWFSKLKENCEVVLKESLPDKFHKAIPELAVYLTESFGNSTRIDYGTGHEMAFLAFLCCIFKIGAMKQIDSEALVFRIFNRYLSLARKLQQTYRMEPAGSQGVWNLDDYQFVPFIWGSSQLVGHPRLLPKSFPNAEICQAFSKDFMFLGCIEYINQVKTGPFAEHSNQLWNISGVPNWNKVNSGLFKMYRAEVLAKFPVIQHFLFGSLMRIDPVL